MVSKKQVTQIMESKKQKTILISSFHGSISRNILQTTIVPILNENNVRVVIVCYGGQKEYIQKIVGERAVVISVDYKTRHIDNIIQIISMGLVTNYNLFMRRIWAEGQYTKVIFAQIIYTLGSKIPTLKRILRWFFRRSCDENKLDAVFAEYKPDVVFSTDVFDFTDSKMLTEASKRGIYTIGMVRSWDNPTTRGILLVHPKKIICWNEIIMDELVRINKFPTGDIFISGIPHHDRVITPPPTTREAFLESMGLDAKKKTIMFAPGGASQYKCDGEILKMFKRLKDENRFMEPVQFLVRQQPHDNLLFNGFNPKEDPDFVIDVPGISLSGKKKESEIRKSDDDSLINSLRFSEVVITLVSSVILDATYYDRPGIIISFEPRKGLKDSTKKFVRYKHMKKLFGWGLLTISKNEDEFVNQVNCYLKDQSLSHDKRAELSRKYAYKLDGQSSQRVADFLIRQFGNL